MIFPSFPTAYESKQAQAERTFAKSGGTSYLPRHSSDRVQYQRSRFLATSSVWPWPATETQTTLQTRFTYLGAKQPGRHLFIAVWL